MPCKTKQETGLDFHQKAIAPANTSISIHRVLTSLELSTREAGQPWIKEVSSVLLWNAEELLIGATILFVNRNKSTEWVM